MITEISNALHLKIVVNEEEKQEVITLLQQEQLPVLDIDDDKVLYLLKNTDQTIGTVGLEIFEDCALLRSVSIIKEEQGKGYGKFINQEIEKYVKDAGINCLYLLTTTAKDFFDKQGYCVINREEAPLSVQRTAEFSSLCPSSAVVMKKKI
ncbi:arsenic resistance N-acetyltransferase ArsN2 [Ferruginibacter sp.]|nr:GNAT family N-acetyltransferase [Ferruginibacter sp.]